MADVIHQVPMPPDELMRLRALRTLDILDTRSDSGNRALNSVAVDLNDALDPPVAPADLPSTGPQRAQPSLSLQTDSRLVFLYVEDNPLSRLVMQGFFEHDLRVRIELAARLSWQRAVDDWVKPLDAARIAQSIAGLAVRRTADATGHL